MDYDLIQTRSTRLSHSSLAHDWSRVGSAPSQKSADRSDGSQISSTSFIVKGSSPESNDDLSHSPGLETNDKRLTLSTGARHIYDLLDDTFTTNAVSFRNYFLDSAIEMPPNLILIDMSASIFLLTAHSFSHSFHLPLHYKALSPLVKKFR